jgi:hypothetical protein
MATVDTSANLEEKVPETGMNTCLSRYYRCPEQYAQLATKKDPVAGNGYFRFGPRATCYGSCSGKRLPQAPDGELYDALLDVVIEDGTVHLPFDPAQAIDNLYREEYVGEWRQGSLSTLARIYYFIRPLLSVGMRRHLQRFHLRQWNKIPFPHWPVDCSVDNLQEELLLLSLRASGVGRIPFIWFWPEGSSSCAIMTHDVETTMGRDTCAALMDIDDSFGIKASFQVVPEERYGVSPEFLQSIRGRGFEVAVHDLNHDGHLYRDLPQFLERAAKINAYGKEYGADGFRAGVLYRKQVWYDALDFAYDMSVPNVAHLDPQHGGCCTVMPYFIGNILELPVTTTQDYSLFNILHEYSIDLWKRQIDLIMEKHGLMSFIVHPDYVIKSRERSVYQQLLSHLRELNKEKGVWLATPGEVNGWWRQRDQMSLVSDESGWHIQGAGSDRGRVAYASESNGRLVFTMHDQAENGGPGAKSPRTVLDMTR